VVFVKSFDNCHSSSDLLFRLEFPHESGKALVIILGLRLSIVNALVEGLELKQRFRWRVKAVMYRDYTGSGSVTERSRAGRGQ
jgi:hypothetical protein